MNKFVGVRFEVVATVINLLTGATIAALAILPRMLYLRETDMAICIIETREAILAAGIL